MSIGGYDQYVGAGALSSAFLMARPRASTYRRLSRLTAAVVVGLGLVVISGWVLHVDVITSLSSGWSTMKLNSALGFVLAGGALWLATERPRTERGRRLRLLLASGATLIGGLTLVEYLFGWHLGIDELVFRDAMPGTDAANPGRPASGTALNFLLIGLALALLDFEIGGRWPAQLLTIVVAALTIFALAGYLYGIQGLSGFDAYSELAPHTTLGFLLPSLGLFLARAERGPAATVFSGSVGGIMVFRLLPVVIAGPVVLAWLILQGQTAGFYDTSYGWTIMAVTTILGFSAVLFWNARDLDRIDQLRQEEVERTRAAEEHRRRDELLYAILLQAPDAIILVNAGGRIRTVNAEAERLFGYAAGDLIGRPIDELVPLEARPIHAEHRAAYVRNPSPLSHRMAAGLDLRGRRQDGSEFAAEINLSPLETEAGLQVIAAVRDVTERREMEAELQRSNAELEQFAYVASHDLQEPLRTVVSFTQLLSRRYAGKLGDDADEFIDFAVDGAKRMQALINDLLVFSRVGRASSELEPTETQAALARALTNLRFSIEESGAEVTSGPLPRLPANPSQLEQLFLNLIGNAVKFRGQAPPRIEVAAKRRQDGWLFSVADNGIGVDAEFAERIFVAFQRLHTRNDYAGNGIGLAICKKIVERHGGRIWVEPNLAGGSIFYFTLPATPRRSPDAATVAPTVESAVA